MAYSDPCYGYQQPRQESNLPDKQINYFDKDNATVLNPVLLEGNMMQLSDDSQLRRGSLAASHGIVSPTESHGWDHHYGGALTAQAVLDSPSDQYSDSSHRMAQVDAHQQNRQQQGFAPSQATHGWVIDPTQSQYGPMRYDHTSQTFDGQQYMSQSRANSVQENIGHPMAGPAPPSTFVTHAEPTFSPTGQVHNPMSPQNRQQWMGVPQYEDEKLFGARRVHFASPPRTSVDMQRRDGVRKKNSRIDIPGDRNAQNIDSLIEHETDEDKLRELKTQKRLLRNREAALASRQRKKKHTEDLEQKEKHYAHNLSDLQSHMRGLEQELQNTRHHNALMKQRYNELQRRLETVQEDKILMAQKHEAELSQLRKRMQIMVDEAERPRTEAMSNGPSSTGFNDFNAGMDNLNMGHDWDSFINDLPDNPPGDIFKLVPTPQVQSLPQRAASATTAPFPQRDTPESPTDQPAMPALLSFLLLCGAFVASKPPGTQSSDVLRFPEEVRAAAPAVLNSLLSDSGPPLNPSNSKNPLGSIFAQTTPTPQYNPSLSDSRLDHVHHHLTSPTIKQEADNAFALTTSQFASMAHMAGSSPHFSATGSSTDRNLQVPLDPMVESRPDLDDSLVSMHGEQSRVSEAEVYSRSVLWTQIPADVIQQFKEMVKDRGYGDGDGAVRPSMALRGLAVRSQRPQPASQQQQHHLQQSGSDDLML